MTIHKIQGATLGTAEIDIGSSIFEYGQSYVALSRVESLDGLYLSTFHPKKIRANPTVITFYEQFNVHDYSQLLSEMEIHTEQVLALSNTSSDSSNIKVIKLAI
jgi:ATP-dependent exoDNAse (exonuclease V) alpha subunit